LQTTGSASKIYNGENWNPGLRAPLSMPGVDVTVGIIISVEVLNLRRHHPYSHLK
jgi:hypothetical protein